MNDRTDPLAGWDLERGMCRGSSVPHRVQGDDQFSAGWLTDEAADQFERAQAITAAWAAQQGTARRFTAEVRECGPVFLAEIRDADGRLLGSTQVRTTRDGLGAFVAQLNASPAPAEDLPPGVVASVDDRYFPERPNTAKLWRMAHSGIGVPEFRTALGRCLDYIDAAPTPEALQRLAEERAKFDRTYDPSMVDVFDVLDLLAAVDAVLAEVGR